MNEKRLLSRRNPKTLLRYAKNFLNVFKRCLKRGYGAVFAILAGLALAGCFPDPEPRCPEECTEIRDEEGYLTACQCSPEYLEDLCECEDERPPHSGFVTHGEDCEE